jgi:hypothetical protein
VASNIQRELAGIELGDQRRNRRVAKLVARMAESPQESLRAACSGWAEAVAGYRLLDNEEVDSQKIIEAHREASLERAAQCQSVLLVQDTTEIDYSSHKAVKGTGPLSDPSRRGFFLHSHLLIGEEQALLLGVCKIHTWARQDAEHGKSELRKQLPIEQKETLRWLRGYEEGCRLATQLPGCEVVMVADRECDIYEIYVSQQQLRQDGVAVADFIVRADDRALADGGRLVERLCSAPPLGTYQVEIERKEQMVKIKRNRRRRVREARQATMEVRSIPVRLRPPWRPGLKLPEVELTAVMVCEKNPPDGQEPIRWVLLTSLKVKTIEQAQRVIRAYTLRWVVEVYYRVLKTGCRVEHLLLRQSRAILAALALYCVVAWRILYLRDLSRSCGGLAGSCFFTKAEWHALFLVSKRVPGTDPPPLEQLTKMVAQLGGYAARKTDPPPGAECLWRGLEKLRCYVEMAQALGVL